MIMKHGIPASERQGEQRRGVVLLVVVVVMAILGLVVASSVRPVRDEAELATLRVETTRAFYSAESGAFVMMNALLGETDMPEEGDTFQIDGQTVRFVQLPVDGANAIIEGASGDATRRIELSTE
ncbi:MAG: hypothetical protein ACF8MF_07260 [Phycisphaerales bacterium JB052]